MNLIESLALLEGRAQEIPGQVQRALELSVAFKSFTASVGAWTDNAGRQADQESALLTQAFTKLEQSVTQSENTTRQHLQQLNGAVSHVRSQAQTEAGEIESDLQGCHQASQALTDQLDKFRQALHSADEHHRASLASARTAAQAARERLMAACDRTFQQLESFQAGVKEMEKSNGDTLSKLHEGVVAATNSSGQASLQFANQSVKAADQLEAGLHEIYDQVVKPSLHQRSSQYQGALQAIHGAIGQSLSQVQSGLEHHDQEASQHGSTLSASYQTHKYHLLSQVVSTDQQLQQRNATVQNAIAKLTHDRGGTPEDTRNWFQKAWDWVVHEVHEIAGGIHAIWDHSSQPVIIKAGALPKPGSSSLLTQDGAGLLTQDGAGLLTQDGAGLLTQDGAGLLTQDGAGLLTQDGAGLGRSGPENQLAQQLETQIQREAQQGQMDRQKAMADVQGKTFEAQQDVLGNKTKTIEKSLEKMAEAPRN